MFYDLIQALEETLFLVFAAGFLTFLIGLPLGIILALTRDRRFFANRLLYRMLNSILYTARQLPYIVLMIALIPLTRRLLGTDEGYFAAIFTLTAASVPFFASQCEQSFRHVPTGVVTACISMGASRFQIFRRVLMPEASREILKGMTLTLIQLVGFSAIAGVLGGGGLGGLVIMKGYPKFQAGYIVAASVLLLLLSQTIKLLGQYLAGGRTFRIS